MTAAALLEPPVVDPPAPADRARERARMAWRAVAAVVAGRSALLLAVAGRYGWHRDELYYFAAGRHLSLGYVDYPPITPLLSAAARVVFGDSLVGQRALAIAAGGVVTVLAAAIARQLGGGRRAQILAAVAVGAGPMLLGSNVLFQTVSFDQVAWAALFLTALRVLERPDVARWATLGLVVGLGLETKYTLVVLVAACAGGVLVTPARRALIHERRRPLVAAAIVCVIVAPNLWWQVQHHWASIEFFRGRNAGTRADNPPSTYVRDLVLLAGPVGCWLAALGLRRLWRDTTTRALAIAAPVVAVTFLVLGGKAYYAAPILTLLVPAGAVVWERRGRGRVLVPVLAFALLVPLLPIGIPILPERTMVDAGLMTVRADYAEELGWPQLVDTVAHVYDAIPVSLRSRTAIVASNYGEAGAIDLYGAARGVPPSTSDHLSYALWHRLRLGATYAVTVGFDDRWLADHCRDHRIVARVRDRQGVHNEEWDAPVATCTLRTTVGDALGRDWHA